MVEVAAVAVATRKPTQGLQGKKEVEDSVPATAKLPVIDILSVAEIWAAVLVTIVSTSSLLAQATALVKVTSYARHFVIVSVKRAPFVVKLFMVWLAVVSVDRLHVVSPVV
jgi:hypothetical protein